MRDHVSRAARAIPPSGIRRFFDLVQTMDGVISLGVGEPDFSTPWKAIDACMYALEQGQTSYTSNRGMPALRERITDDLARDFGLCYDPETEVIVTAGVSEGLDIAIRAVTDPGDEVLVAEPSYVELRPVRDPRRRRAGRCSVHRARPVPARPRPADGAGDAAFEGARHQLSEQPDRGRDDRLRSEGDRGRGRGPRPRAALGRGLLGAQLRGAARAGRDGRRAPRADDHPERVLEGLRNDRMASRVPLRARRARRTPPSRSTST